MKSLFQLSIVDIMAASTVGMFFATLNALRRDIGYGSRFTILIQGWPFLALTDHSGFGLTVHWLGVIANLSIGVFAVAVTAVSLSQFRQRAINEIAQQYNIGPRSSQDDPETAHPLDFEESDQSSCKANDGF